MSTASLILLADTVHTLDPGRPSAQAVAVKDGVIVGVGDRTEARTWRGPDTEVIDLGSSTLTPGLVDGHFHPIMGIGLTRGANLSDVTSVPELVARLRTLDVDEAGWVLAWGLNPNAFGAEPITNAPLVEALGDQTPVLINLFDAHSGLASPAALRAAGITGPRRFDGGAEVVCDASGHPTGQLLELPAYHLVRDVAPPESAASRRGRLSSLLQGMAATGITGGNAMDFVLDSEHLISQLETDGELPLRIRFAPFCDPGMTGGDLDHIIDLQRLRGRRWQVDGVKFMIDGTIDGGTAWLDEPDTLGESHAPYWPEPRAWAEAIARLAAAGVPTVTHAIGDAGVRYVLDTLRDLPPRTSPVPHRIEHIETVPDDLIERFARQNVTASMQPTHCTLYSRADHGDNWSRRLGPDRANRGWRTRDLRTAGARVALGSDWPVAPYDARSVLADARLRRPSCRPDVAPIQPQQGLTPRMALEGYTSHAAAAAGLEGVAGMIREGYRADLTAFALDPLTCDPDELADGPIPLTVVDGRISHRQ